MYSGPRGQGSRRAPRAYNRGRGGWQRSPFAQQTPEERPSSPPLGALAQTVKQDILLSHPEADDALAIHGCRFLGSFNWLKSKNPTIAVPGAPPVWKPLGEPKELSEDSGDYFRDQNAARFPQHPMEPAVWALLAQNPGFSTDDTDVFACGSTLGNLLRFVRRVDKPFRFTVEAVGNTVFFVRRENQPDEKILGVRGYGHSFPDSYTEWQADIKDSVSHQRLLEYEFADLKCIIRYEGDGYLEHLAEQSTIANNAPGLADMDGLNVQSGGRQVPRHAIFDLKTRSAKRKGDNILAEELPRLWITQTQNFVLAFHERGVFHDIRIQDVRKDIDAWEQGNQGALRQLATLMRKLIEYGRNSTNGRCEVRCKEVGTLEVRSTLDDAPAAMSEKLRQVWIRGPWSSPQSDDETSAAAGGAPLSSADSDSSGEGVDVASFSDDESAPDYTACSAECGYCGCCKY